MAVAHERSCIQRESLGLRAWAGKFHPMPTAHCHHDLELNYVLDGTVAYLVAGSVITLPPRRLCALWGVVPHCTVRPDRRVPEAFWATVPLPQVLAWRLPEAFVRRLWREGIVIEDDEQTGDPALFQRWIADLRTVTDEPPRATLLEIEARLWRMASCPGVARRPKNNRRATGKTAAGTEIPAAVERLAAFLARRYREPVSIEDAARAAHVHPNYAMTLFRRHAGLTLHGYLTLQRVAHAQRLLATTTQPILDVALNSGFASVSSFYEAFRAQAGMSPRRFRLRMGGSA